MRLLTGLLTLCRLRRNNNHIQESRAKIRMNSKNKKSNRLLLLLFLKKTSLLFWIQFKASTPSLVFENFSLATHTASVWPTCAPSKVLASFAIFNSLKTPTAKFLIYQIWILYRWVVARHLPCFWLMMIRYMCLELILRGLGFWARDRFKWISKLLSKFKKFQKSKFAQFPLVLPMLVVLTNKADFSHGVLGEDLDMDLKLTSAFTLKRWGTCSSFDWQMLRPQNTQHCF